jgi:hypothetical protein
VFEEDFEKWYKEEIALRVKCDTTEAFKRILKSIYKEQYKEEENK